jgi:antitoxin component YwqK of YwqJK toxin-antitoxin module
MRTRAISLLILPVLLWMCLPGNAQEQINRVDAKGMKQGGWKKYDTAGNMLYAGQFRDDIPVDTFRYFYPGGKLKTISVFSENGHRVKSVSYFRNGQPMAKGIYMDEKKDSIWQFFSEYDGTLISEENYRTGKKDGVSKIFFPGGGISETISWKNDVRDGLWEIFYSDGKVKMKGANSNGDKSGPFVFYYATGKVMIAGEYLEGHQHGTWNYYSGTGEIVKTEIYDKGILLDKIPKD